jgi:hypothetical protein
VAGIGVDGRQNGCFLKVASRGTTLSLPPEDDMGAGCFSDVEPDLARTCVMEGERVVMSGSSADPDLESARRAESMVGEGGRCHAACGAAGIGSVRPNPGIVQPAVELRRGAFSRLDPVHERRQIRRGGLNLRNPVREVGAGAAGSCGFPVETGCIFLDAERRVKREDHRRAVKAFKLDLRDPPWNLVEEGEEQIPVPPQDRRIGRPGQLTDHRSPLLLEAPAEAIRPFKEGAREQEIPGLSHGLCP